MRRALASLALTAALAVPAAASAEPTGYDVRHVTEPAHLDVAPPLEDLVAGARARLVVPDDWTEVRSSTGRRSWLTRRSSCRYRVTAWPTTVVDDPGDATARVEASLPEPDARRVLDEGTHGPAAFRVVRRSSVGGQVRIVGTWSRVLTRRDDVDGGADKVVWTDLRVVATSRKGDECHSGTWRETMGPALGDMLAGARATLRFIRAGRR